MNILEFTVYGNPISLKRHRTFQRGDFKGTYDPSKNDKADFLAKAMEYKPEQPLECPLKLSLVFNFQRPKSHYRTGKNALILKNDVPACHISRPDIDNLMKFVADSFNGVFWKDDACLSTIIAQKRYSKVPSVVVKIEKDSE